LKKINFLFILVLLIFPNVIYATKIGVVNIDILIENNNSYVEVVKNIEKSQEQYLKDFEKIEIKLQKMLDELESSKLILNEEETNKVISEYNKELAAFTELIDKFNAHYQDQFINIKNKILKEIIKLLEKYAVDQNIELILDSTSYLIASNALDITDVINTELNKLKIDLNFEEFANN
tara:strand:+ start:42 stop:575 length:534 start_codon:yes stop_codon:yes gene_type:complete